MDRGTRAGGELRQVCFHLVWLRSGLESLVFPPFLSSLPSYRCRTSAKTTCARAFFVITAFHRFYKLEIDYDKYRSEDIKKKRHGTSIGLVAQAYSPIYLGDWGKSTFCWLDCFLRKSCLMGYIGDGD